MYAVEYHKDIVEILDGMKRELLLVLKTNNYLRAIDKRFGNPANSYNIIVSKQVLVKLLFRMKSHGKCGRKKLVDRCQLGSIIKKL